MFVYGHTQSSSLRKPEEGVGSPEAGVALRKQLSFRQQHYTFLTTEWSLQPPETTHIPWFVASSPHFRVLFPCFICTLHILFIYFFFKIGSHVAQAGQL